MIEACCEICRRLAAIEARLQALEKGQPAPTKQASRPHDDEPIEARLKALRERADHNGTDAYTKGSMSRALNFVRYLAEERREVITYRMIRSMSDSEFLRTPNFGKQSLRYMRAVAGYDWGPDISAEMEHAGALGVAPHDAPVTG